MEGGGGNNPPERTPRIVHDFDLNVKLEPEEEPELEQLPRNVIHDLEEENPQVGVLFDTGKVEQQKEMDMVVKPNKYARAEKGLKVRDAKMLSGGGTGVRLKVNIKESNAGAKQELTGRGMKRARVYSGSTTESESSDPTSSAGDDDATSAPPEETSGTPKEGNAEGFMSSVEEGRNP